MYICTVFFMINTRQKIIYYNDDAHTNQHIFNSQKT